MIARPTSTSVTVAMDAILREHARACLKFTGFKNAHEGYAVLLEEVDELWEEVRRKEQSRDALLKEATQVAAMALRFMIDVCLKEPER